MNLVAKYLVSYMVTYEDNIGEKTLTGSQLVDEGKPTYQGTLRGVIKGIKEQFKDLRIKQVCILGISEILYEEEYQGEIIE